MNARTGPVVRHLPSKDPKFTLCGMFVKVEPIPLKAPFCSRCVEINNMSK